MKRREFLGKTAVAGLTAGAGMTVLTNPLSARGTPANERVNLAFVGCGGRGRQLLGDFILRNDINIVTCCDPNLARVDQAMKVLSAKELKAKSEQDFRNVLDDRSVDAVVSATPDHWHALITVLACQAGFSMYTSLPA